MKKLHLFFLVSLIVVTSGCGTDASAATEEFSSEQTEETLIRIEIPTEQEVSAGTTVFESETEQATVPDEECLKENQLGLAKNLLVDEDPELYTYDDMAQDLICMERKYPQIVSVESVADTFDGRKVYHMTIGKSDASKHIFINASIHAREYMTTQLVMKQASDFLSAIVNNEITLGDMAIHVVPMVNPDGVTISQLGVDGLQTEQAKARVQEIISLDGADGSEKYYRRWKSNANGVDLNRNFDALWEQYGGPGHPSSDHYKGTAPGCEPESRALIELTRKYDFDYTVSYHTQGEVIYWYFGQTGALKEKSQKLAQKLSSKTGYALDANYQNLDPAGYKDWGIKQCGISGVTIEIGRQTSPVPSGQFNTIWSQNKEIWRLLLQQFSE